MAVDSAQKRRSLVGYGLPFRIALPEPDGTITQGDRQHLAGMYSGILAAPAVRPILIIRPAIAYVLAREPIAFVTDRPPITFTES